MNMKSVIRSIKNEINNYDEGERLVRELTSNESTPPSTQMLIKLKIMLSDQYQFPTIIRMLFKRLKDYNNIRHVEKALICIEYLLQHADRKFVRYCQMDEKSVSKLMRYRYILNMKDYGHNIRKRAKRITTLLKNDDLLRQKRAQAQGYSMSFKNKNKNKNKNKSNYKSKSKSKPKSRYVTQKPKPKPKPKSKPAPAKKKKKKKIKKVKDPVIAPPDDNTPSQPQFASLIDVPPDNPNPATSNGNNVGNGNVNSDDLLAEEWWKQETADAFDANDDFGWYQSGDNNDNNVDITAAGADGGEFGFGVDDDFDNDNDNKDDANNATVNPDKWMSTLTAMDNVLDGNITKKDKNKRNNKGTSMAQLAAQKPTKNIPNSFGTDNFFEQNSNPSNNSNTNNNSSNINNNNDNFDPFGLDNKNTASSGSSQFSHLYNQNQNKNTNSNQSSMGSFGYQPKANSNPYGASINDPFAGIGGMGRGNNTSNKNTNVQPATYVPRQKPTDPFAQFGSMK